MEFLHVFHNAIRFNDFVKDYPSYVLLLLLLLLLLFFVLSLFVCLFFVRNFLKT